MPETNPGLGLIVINGTDADDQDPNLTGTIAAEWIRGFDGDDVVKAEGGDDVVQGGDGNDDLDGGSGSDEVDGGAGDDLIRHDPSKTDGVYDTDTYDGGAGFDTLHLNLTQEEWILVQDEYFAFKNDFLPSVKNSAGIATAKPFTFNSLNLTVKRFEDVQVTIDGVPLTVIETDPDGGPVVIDLSDSDADQYIVLNGDGDASIKTGGGNDTIVATGSGNHVIDAGDGNNVVTTGSGDDDVTTGGGDDIIDTGPGNDVISSGAGRDIVEIGEGDDVLDAGPGDDITIAGQGAGDELLDGNDGNNLLIYPSITTRIVVDLRQLVRTDEVAEDGSGRTWGEVIDENIIENNWDIERDDAIAVASGVDIDADVLFNYQGAIGGTGDDFLRGADYSVPGSFHNTLVGDADILLTQGGADTVFGGTPQGDGVALINDLYGDAREIQTGGQGGDDRDDALEVGVFGGFGNTGALLTNNMYGDAGVIWGNAQGGSDFLLGAYTGGGTVHNNMFGDAGTMHAGAKGGADLMRGGNIQGSSFPESGKVYNMGVGDAELMLSEELNADDDLGGGLLILGARGFISNTFYGDFIDMEETDTAFAKGGDDRLNGGDIFSNSLGEIENTFYGDGHELWGVSEGGDDFFRGGHNSSEVENPSGLKNLVTDIFYGDAHTMHHDSVGGDDTFRGGFADTVSTSFVMNSEYYGDAFTMLDNAQGGADRMTGADNKGNGSLTNSMFGEANDMHGNTTGGIDNLTGGNLDTDTISRVINVLVGEARLMDGNAMGAGDTLTGGDFINGTVSINTIVANLMVGDALTAEGMATGGADRLIAGLGALTENRMYGDWVSAVGPDTTGGADTFVFRDLFGETTIFDFDKSEGDSFEIDFATADLNFFDLFIHAVDNGMGRIDTKITAASAEFGTITLLDYDNNDPALKLTLFDFDFV